jgi:3-methylcrotonyl-CoA carboxylase alpha subunit
LRGYDDALYGQVTHSPSQQQGVIPPEAFKPYAFDRTTQTLSSARGVQTFELCAVGATREIQHGAHRWRLHRLDPYAPPASEEEGSGHLRAPMPGTIISVMVKVGDTVSAGQPLLVMEAMKMEHTIKAPSAGRVVHVHFKAGDQVKEGAELVEIG